VTFRRSLLPAPVGMGSSAGGACGASPSRARDLIQGHRRLPVAKRWPPKRLAKASASSGLAKQNTTKSLSSRRREYVSCAADRPAAAANISPLFLRPRTFSAGRAT
jgi:hypothetical protein